MCRVSPVLTVNVTRKRRETCQYADGHYIARGVVISSILNMMKRRIMMGKISISLECNSIEEAKALLDFLATYRKEVSDNPSEVEDRKVTAEEVNRLTKDVLKEISENLVSESPKPVEVDEGKEVTAEDISRFAVSLLRQGKGHEIKNMLAAYGYKSFTDIPKDKRALFLSALKRI